LGVIFVVWIVGAARIEEEGNGYLHIHAHEGFNAFVRPWK
jgi:hypothetical protein